MGDSGTRVVTADGEGLSHHFDRGVLMAESETYRVKDDALAFDQKAFNSWCRGSAVKWVRGDEYRPILRPDQYPVPLPAEDRAHLRMTLIQDRELLAQLVFSWPETKAFVKRMIQKELAAASTDAPSDVATKPRATKEACNA